MGEIVYQYIIATIVTTIYLARVMLPGAPRPVKLVKFSPHHFYSVIVE